MENGWVKRATSLWGSALVRAVQWEHAISLCSLAHDG